MNPTVADVAKLAGVGVATVDRVINKRAAVRPETAQRVLEAAQQLGFYRTGLIKNRIDEQQRSHTFGFILQNRQAHFYRELGLVLEEAAAVHGRAVISYMDEFTPRQVAARLHEMAQQVDAIALVAADHPQINQAIDAVSIKGVPVFALVSDLTAASRAGYIGLDNRQMGRTAAWGISRLCSKPGKVGLILGSHRYLCQEQCEIGFRSFLREHAPQFQVLETMTSLEHSHLAESATLELFKHHPDLVGVYVAGGGIEGVLEALKASRPSGLVTICHDLSSTTRQALNENLLSMVLSHPMEWMASRLLEVMSQSVQSKSIKGAVQVVLPFTTYTMANI